jgi:hypothetical protein
MTSANTLADPVQLYGLATAAVHDVSLSQSMAGTSTMVRMALALKSLDLDHLVFVQYPTLPSPVNPDKVVPNPTLAAKLVARVRADQRIALDTNALGPAAVASGTPTPRSTASPRPTRTDSATVAGLRGRTAAQQTCSVAN